MLGFMFKFLHHFEDATVIFGVISLCFLGLCSTLSDISILIFIYFSSKTFHL